MEYIKILFSFLEIPIRKRFQFDFNKEQPLIKQQKTNICITNIV